MTHLDAVLLGIVEGLTEFLPISSTGHLILASELLGLPETEFLKSFAISIQLGAILAVVLLYWRRFFLDRAVLEKVAVALLPALALGFVFYAGIRSLLASEATVVFALFVGGVFLIAFERYRQIPALPKTLETMTRRDAFAIGCAQAISIIPGVSRAGASIVGGLLVRLSRSSAVEFSFLLSVPTIFAATGLEIVKNPALFAAANFSLLATGFIVSFVVALVAIRGFLRFVQSHSFVGFGVYRILAALFFFFLVL